MCVYVLCVPALCTTHIQVPAESVGSSGAGVMGSSEMLVVCFLDDFILARTHLDSNRIIRFYLVIFLLHKKEFVKN